MYTFIQELYTFFLSLTNFESRSEKSRGLYLPLIMSSNSAEVRHRKRILYGNSAYLWWKANERRSKSQVHAQLRKWQPALAVGGSRETVATVLGGQSNNFVQTLPCAHACLAIVEIMDEETPGECTTVIAPRNTITVLSICAVFPLAARNRYEDYRRNVSDSALLNYRTSAII